MYKKVIFLFFCLVFSTGISFAQNNDLPSLRDLAELNHLNIGVAVATPHLRSSLHAGIVSSEFNILTHEYEAKFCAIQNIRGMFDFRAMDEVVEFAQANNISIHGHTLLWYQCVPSWLTNAKFTREEAIQVMRDYIMTVVGRYRGRIDIWDVVNEGIGDDGNIREMVWQKLIGDDYMELAFQFAHEANPDARLFYNDHDIEALNGKSDAVYDLLQDFIARGIPIHGIGFQGHFEMWSINYGSIRRNIRRFANLGLELNFTEVDIRFSGEPDEDNMRKLADDYRSLMNICLDNEACTTFIMWGLTDSYSWLRNENMEFFNNPDVAPLLFDDDYQPKLAYFAILDALARHAGEPPILSDEEIAVIAGKQEAVFEIPEPTKSNPDQLSPDSVEGRVYYVPFPVTIKLDGETDDWENIPRVTFSTGNLVPENNDTSMTFAVVADDTHVYFLADVTDSKLVYGTHEINEWYREDSVEFYFNTTGDLNADSYIDGIVQIGILAANMVEHENPLLAGRNSDDIASALEFVVVETQSGYLVEASVPLITNVWTIKPKHEAVVGFQAQLNGSSGEGRDTKLIWSVLDKNDQSWSNPSLFGQLIFWDIEENN